MNGIDEHDSERVIVTTSPLETFMSSLKSLMLWRPNHRIQNLLLHHSQNAKHLNEKVQSFRCFRRFEDCRHLSLKRPC